MLLSQKANLHSYKSSFILILNKIGDLGIMTHAFITYSLKWINYREPNFFIRCNK